MKKIILTFIFTLIASGVNADDLSKVTDKAQYVATMKDATVTVGGDGTKFVPSVDIAKWNREAFISLRFPGTVAGEKESIVGKSVNLALTDRTYKFYTHETKKWVLEGEMVFSAAPGVDSIDCNITFPDGVEFWKQRSLAEEYADKPLGYPTLAAYLEDHIRPDNVVNSYAVYWNKKNNQYKTGKICHIYRFQATDSLNKQAWCDLDFSSVSKTSGVLKISLPKSSWWSTAAYPVVVMGAGDTFGVEAEGASEDNCEADVNGVPATPAGSGVITEYHGWMYESTDAGAHDVVMGLYDTSDNFMGDGSDLETDLTTNMAEITFSISGTGPTIVASTTYILTIMAGGGGGSLMVAYDSNSTGRQHTTSEYPTWPNPITWDEEDSGMHYSFYGVYSGASTGTQVIIISTD